MHLSPRAPLLALLIAIPSGCADDTSDLLAPEDPAGGVLSAAGITVMSQNMYLGASLNALLTPGGDLTVPLQELLTSNAAFPGATPPIPARMFRLAELIAAQDPDLVGLQEVTTWTFTPPGGPAQTLDYLETIHYLLSVMTGAPWAAVRNPLADPPVVAVPLAPGVDLLVKYNDADAILYRMDRVTPLGPPILERYESKVTYTVGGTSFPNWRGYMALPVQVDATGDRFIFVNTHLEVQDEVETQLAQTAELIRVFHDAALPVVMVGDFNSAANHDAPETQKTPTYGMLRNAGFQDLWVREARSVGGVTCCQAGDLTNAESQLGQRLDLVLVRYGGAGFGGQSTMDVTGEEQADRVEVVPGALTLWPSDHAGVAATFWPAPGLSRMFAN